ncbi:MAG: protein-disulfide reductase DsbD domain-containing protein, partial [Acidimicrobiales bacterium]
PGTFLLDADGVVVEKLFDRSHRIRPGGKLLLERLELDATAATQIVTADGPGLSVAVWADTPDYFPNQVNRLTVRIGLADGLHVYVPPNPRGFINLTVEIDAPPGVFVQPHEMPTGHPFEVEGLTEKFTVVEGEFQIVIPFYILEDSGEVTLPIQLNYQACSATTCHPPDSVELVVELTEVRA